ncbi:hypothetical protein NDU88_004120, partial [Pleurodeles waltl]
RAADQRSSRGRCSAERFLPLLFILLLLKARNKQCLQLSSSLCNQFGEEVLAEKNLELSHFP